MYNFSQRLLAAAGATRVECDHDEFFALYGAPRTRRVFLTATEILRPSPSHAALPDGSTSHSQSRVIINFYNARARTQRNRNRRAQEERVRARARGSTRLLHNATCTTHSFQERNRICTHDLRQLMHCIVHAHAFQEKENKMHTTHKSLLTEHCLI